MMRRGEAFPVPLTIASVRSAVCALASGLALLSAAGASAQELPAAKITGDDLRRALIWTGHYSVMAKGDATTVFHDAFQGWQKSKGYPAADNLPDEQVSELLAEGDKQRDAVGWTTLEDKSIGFSIGVPTKLVKFVAARPSDGSLRYDFEGKVGYRIWVHYGDLSCSRMVATYTRLLRFARPSYRAYYGGGFVMAANAGGGQLDYLYALCRTSGGVVAEIDIPGNQADRQEFLFSAMVDSLRIGANFNPTALAHPRIAPPTPTAADFYAVSASSRPKAGSKPSGTTDDAGKTAEIKRETRGDGDLNTEQIFDKASAAVYKVDAGERLGSAVAISEHDLLTNCHVVKDKARVTIAHDKTQQSADVISVNEKADRCVLRAEAALPKWVTVRPYDDIKVGERAVTIGTPQGLELTVAEGIVSSKRTLDGRRLVQTTAAISQGSSGGGLFDGEGHLLGITTFYLKVGQNLNFAVAAEDFAK
jgi:hypothetical protein